MAAAAYGGAPPPDDDTYDHTEEEERDGEDESEGLFLTLSQQVARGLPSSSLSLSSATSRSAVSTTQPLPRETEENDEDERSDDRGLPTAAHDKGDAGGRIQALGRRNRELQAKANAEQARNAKLVTKVRPKIEQSRQQRAEREREKSLRFVFCGTLSL
jgi:hypothetical protein